MNSALFRRRSRIAGNRARFYRPLVENLESRDLLAINTTISTNATANVTSVTANNTTTFTATTTGANVSITDIDSALAGGKNVVIDSGAAGVQSGTIFTSGITSFDFNNANGTTLTIHSGTGLFSDQADVTLTGLQMTKQGTLIIDANDNVNLSGDLGAGTMTITAGASISMPSGGELAATILSLTAGADIGTSALPVLTNVSQLTTDTSANNTDQFITEASGLTALSLNAGSGKIVLNVTAGAVSDNDTSNDITSASVEVSLSDATAKDFGTAAHPIGTSVDSLIVITSANFGSQFITESQGLTGLQLFAGTGNVTLTVTKGAVFDPDSFNDITATSATVTLTDPTATDFGAAANPIKTVVNSLSVDTSAGGSQFITQTIGLTALNLNAGTGNVTLIVTSGAISDSDPDTDVTAAIANIGLSDLTAKDFGTSENLIGTSVDSLFVSTTGGAGGSQFIREANGLNELQLLSGVFGNVTLKVTKGAVADTDPVNDIFAAATTVTLLDLTAKDFGSSANPIGTSVDSLSVDTSAGKGNQFITENNGLTALNLNSFSSGNVNLIVTQGAVADADSDLDIAASNVTVLLSDVASSDFGSLDNPIAMDVSSLSVNTTAGDGDQFIEQNTSLSGLDLNAGSGDVTFTLFGSSLTDSDNSPDIVAATASITVTAGGIGTQSSPLETNVDSLSVSTASNTQILKETDSVTVTSLDAGTGSILLKGGTYNLATGNAVADLNALIVFSPAIVNLASGEETVGSLLGGGTVNFKADGANHILTVGANNVGGNFSGSLTGNDVVAGTPQDKLLKIGTGELELSGSNSFTGAYDVTAGRLLVTGSIAASTTLVKALTAGTVGGSGTINRGVQIGDGGHLAPGDAVGVLTTNNLQFLPGAAFDVEITSAAANQFDQANVTGTVSIATTGAGAALNITKSGTLSLNDNDEIVIIKNDGNGATGDAISGTFAGLTEGQIVQGSNFLGSGHTAKITYKGGDGNDISLKISPGSLFPWHNDTAGFANDVRGGANNQPDGHIVADDVIAIINFINARGSGPVPADAVIGLPFGFLDTKPDNQIVAEDVINVINFINAHPGQAEAEAAIGEGEAPAEPIVGANLPISSTPSDNLLALIAADLAQQPTRRRRV